MKRLFGTIFLLTLCVKAHCAPITIRDTQDYLVLNQFFKMMFQHSEFGSVYDGTKPMLRMRVSATTDLMAPESFDFELSTCAREAIRVWQKIAPKQGSLVLKIAEVGDYYELVFINTPRLQAEIESNINLFRYVLGPTISVEYLVSQIAQSSSTLNEILYGDRVLVGIALGLGTNHSLLQSYSEDAQNGVLVNDTPPFASRRSPLNPGEDRSLKLTYLSQIGGNRSVASLGVENQKSIAQSDLSLKKQQRLLDRSDFLECVLEKMTGEKPLIRCTTAFAQAPLGNTEELIAASILQLSGRLDADVVPVFINAFCHSFPTDSAKETASAMPGALTGLKRAKSNLQFADTLFASLAQSSLIEIVPGHLYVDLEKVGKGKKVSASERLLVNYSVEDGCGNVLTAAHNTWIELSSTLPGFAHAVQGMREGEIRTVYIHPSLAYGAMTSLPPCVPLVVKVTLHQIDSHSASELPELQPIDLAWVKDPIFFREIEESSYQLAKTMGNRWGTWIQRCGDVDFLKVRAYLKTLSNSPTLSQKESNQESLCNRIFWNMVTGAPKLQS